jgi:hypothetical protein
LWQSYKPLVTIYIIVPPFVNSSLLENSYFAVLYPFTSYVKLQEAYVAEQGNAIGNFQTIGYVVPGGKSGETTGSTTNFTYAQSGTYSEGSAVNPNGAKVWSATSKAKLNNCSADEHWILNATIAANSDGVTWESDALDEGCKALTPNFDKIAKAKTGP